MLLERRSFLAGSAALAAAGWTPTKAQAAPSTLSSLGIDARQLGVHPGRTDDQTRALQRAIEQAASARVPLVLAPGTYRAGGVRLPSGAHLLGMRSASRLLFGSGNALLSAEGADQVTVEGLVLDGENRPLPEGRGILHLSSGRGVRIVDCEVLASMRSGIVLESIEGEARGNLVSGARGAGLFSRDARGLTISGNTVRGCGNNGILVWRSQAGDDGTMVVGNRIEEIAAEAGGSGQNGNAINVFRAANVLVAQNRIRNVAFTAVRGNAASNLQVLGNNCAQCGEVAIYAEFGFEGALIAQNVVDGAAIGVAVTNFNVGGRLAVVQGNIIRHLSSKRPAGTDPNDGAGIGIGVEADSAVTGNVIEGAPTAGIALGWGRHLRDVAVTGNIVRGAGVGVAVSVSAGAGQAVIADNLLADTRNGAIVGMDLKRPVTGDLAKEGAGRFAQLTISGNRVR